MQSEYWFLLYPVYWYNYWTFHNRKKFCCWPACQSKPTFTNYLSTCTWECSAIHECTHGQHTQALYNDHTRYCL